MNCPDCDEPMEEFAGTVPGGFVFHRCDDCDIDIGVGPDDPTEDRTQYDESLDVPWTIFCPECGSLLVASTIAVPTAAWCEECDVEWTLEGDNTLIDRRRHSIRR